MTRKEILSQDTLIPLSLFITMAGAIYWFSTMAAMGAQNRSDIDQIKAQNQLIDTTIAEKLDRQSNQLSDIRASVSALNAKIEILTKEIR